MSRWISRDPIGEWSVLSGLLRFTSPLKVRRLLSWLGQQPPYLSVYNRPIDHFDPDGLYGNPVSGPDGPVGPSDPYPNYPTVPYLVGFIVLGSEIELWFGGLLQWAGFDHVDIAYNGTVVYLGRGGGVDRMGRNYVARDSVYPLNKKTWGHMMSGKKAPCLKCKDANDSDILDCLQSRSPREGRNCQGDVEDATGECCLSGWHTIVGSLFPSL
jgi:hypothetical protein